MTLQYVDLETAKAARGTRVVVNALVPSPWSEALKACLHLGKVPVLAVKRVMDVAAIDAWTGIDNVPALRHDREPVRSNWAALVTCVDRLARVHGGAQLLPDGIGDRAHAMGTLGVIAGEEGLGWNARLAMIDASLASKGAKGFPEPVAKFLAKRYGYVPDTLAAIRDRIGAQLAWLGGELRGDYFGGAAPNAIDAYAATFLTPVVGPVTEADCPAMVPIFRAAFAFAHEAFGTLVPPALVAHRKRMFEQHLPFPIEL